MKLNINTIDKGSPSLVECVINISEGRDLEKLKQISMVFDQHSEVHLLHIDIGKAANRSVLTILGEKTKIVDSVFELFQVATQLIDMRQHQGIHPRIGSVDVCPFIPFKNSTLEECISLAHELGERVWKKLKVPIYFYAQAAKREKYQFLVNCRRGEYEGIKDRIKDLQQQPDFGGETFNRQSGISVIGARGFLIAYNINLKTTSIKIAKKIASILRESQNKDNCHSPGLPCVKAIGWYVEEYGMTQVSTNIIDFRVTSIFKVFDTVVEEARRQGIEVRGSELIGMIPLEALLPHKDRHLRSEKIQDSVQCLGLDSLAPFVPEERILELKLEGLI